MKKREAPPHSGRRDIRTRTEFVALFSSGFGSWYTALNSEAGKSPGLATLAKQNQETRLPLWWVVMLSTPTTLNPQIQAPTKLNILTPLPTLP
jgi:hypothetical protein